MDPDRKLETENNNDVNLGQPPQDVDAPTEPNPKSNDTLSESFQDTTPAVVDDSALLASDDAQGSTQDVLGDAKVSPTESASSAESMSDPTLTTSSELPREPSQEPELDTNAGSTPVNSDGISPTRNDIFVPPVAETATPDASSPIVSATAPPASRDVQTSSVTVGEGPAVGTGGMPAMSDKVNARKPNKRMLLIIVAAVLVLIGLTTGYVFGYYIPNKPENVWKSALVNTGKGYDAMTEYEAIATKDVKGLDMQGSYRIKGAIVSDGTFVGKSLGSDSQFTGSISAAGLKVNYDVRSIKSAGDTPDFYFKVTGIQGIGDLVGGSGTTIASTLNGLNNQWYVIDHTLFEQLASSTGSATSTKYSEKDVQALLKTIGEPSKTYLFTDDATKAVFVQKSYVGAEKRDSRSVYHYKAGVDETHLKLYLKALCQGLDKDKIGKLLLDNGLASTDCINFSDRADQLDTTQTADVWVDRSTKLVHAVRFTDKKLATNYIEISQDYQGGTVYPFGLVLQTKAGSDTMLASLAGSVDTATNTLKITGKLDDKGSQASSGSFDLSYKPNTDTSFKVATPENAKNIMQLLNDLGIGQLLGGTSSSDSQSGLSILPGVQSQARDSERQTDINALDSHIEAYYAQYGEYPALAQLNDASWRTKNMQGLDSAALKDPQGSSTMLVSSPRTGAFAYEVDAQHSKFTLTATLEDGTTYTKSSF